MQALRSLRVICSAVNPPGPLTAARLRDLGASVVKVEPEGGDPMAQHAPAWYEALVRDMDIVRLNLKGFEGRARLEALMQEADLLITANRPAALQRLGLGWEQVHARFNNLCYVAIVGYPPPRENEAGHDLTYEAELGLITPPHMPRVLVPDLAGTEWAVSASLELLLARERGQGAGYRMVSLKEAGESFSAPWRAGLTQPDGLLGGGLPTYNIYPTQSGYVALAALEAHFLMRLCQELSLSEVTKETLTEAFAERTAAQWEAWAKEKDLPLTAVRGSLRL